MKSVRNVLITVSLVLSMFNLLAMESTSTTYSAFEIDKCLLSANRRALYDKLLKDIAQGKLRPEQVLALSGDKSAVCVLEKVAQANQGEFYETARRVIANLRSKKYLTSQAAEADRQFALANLIIIRDGLPSHAKTRQFCEAYTRLIGDIDADCSSAFSWKQ